MHVLSCVICSKNLHTIVLPLIFLASVLISTEPLARLLLLMPPLATADAVACCCCCCCVRIEFYFIGALKFYSLFPVIIFDLCVSFCFFLARSLHSTLGAIVSLSLASILVCSLFSAGFDVISCRSDSFCRGINIIMLNIIKFSHLAKTSVESTTRVYAKLLWFFHEF
jgi:hypothetical protein